MKQIIIILFLMITTVSFSQKKKEKEVFIKEEAMPEKAVQLLDKYKEQTHRRRDYLKEYNAESESFEAKFYENSTIYSAEFDIDGNLEDVEVIVKEKEVTPATLKKMEAYLSEKFSKHKIEKIQAQYKKDSPDQTIKDALAIKHPQNYELVVYVKENKEYKKYEFLFDAAGNFKTQQEISTDSFDYLLF